MIDKTFRVLLGVAAVIAMLTTAPVRATDKINVVTSNTGFLYVTAYIAQEMGYFKDADLVVEVPDKSPFSVQYFKFNQYVDRV